MEGISGGGGATVIEDNGCLSQQLLSKEGGRRKRCNNRLMTAVFVTLKSTFNNVLLYSGILLFAMVV